MRKIIFAFLFLLPFISEAQTAASSDSVLLGEWVPKNADDLYTAEQSNFIFGSIEFYTDNEHNGLFCKELNGEVHNYCSEFYYTVEKGKITMTVTFTTTLIQLDVPREITYRYDKKKDELIFMDHGKEYRYTRVKHVE